jgi:hypothetical protein
MHIFLIYFCNCDATNKIRSGKILNNQATLSTLGAFVQWLQNISCESLHGVFKWLTTLLAFIDYVASAFSLTLDHIALGYNIQPTTMSTSSISAFSLPVSFIISDLTILCVSNEIEKTNCIKN